MNDFIVEKVTDLSFDPLHCPLSKEIRETWVKLISTNNPIMDNGQMVCLNLPDEIRNKIIDYGQKILMEFIESEKLINECYNIKNKYISNEDDVNNTNLYVKNIFNIIVNMDRSYKYLWNIVKDLIDNVESYKEYILWQNNTTKIGTEVYNKWDLIYNIRNEIEHPKNIRTTMFSRVNGGSVIPQIIYENKSYDLLEIANEALQCMCIYFCTIIQAAFLNSKYVVAFTDESRKIIYGSENTING